MSITSWKNEFLGKVRKMPVDYAIEHALKKWKGLKQKNLEKHQLTKDGGHVVYKGRRLHMGDENCTLCWLFRNDDCLGCPLQTKTEEDCIGPWAKWVNEDNPGPMIRRIQWAKRKLENQ